MRTTSPPLPSAALAPCLRDSGLPFHAAPCVCIAVNARMREPLRREPLTTPLSRSPAPDCGPSVVTVQLLAQPSDSWINTSIPLHARYPALAQSPESSYVVRDGLALDASSGHTVG